MIGHDVPNVNPLATAMKRFRVGYYGTRFLGGYALYRLFRDRSALRDDYYTRPDFKPKAAMVPESNYDKRAEAQVRQLYSPWYFFFGINYDHKTSWFKRLFNPNDADFTPKIDLYRPRENAQYRHRDGAFPTHLHDYMDHKHHL
jgi:hypothetical protein